MIRKLARWLQNYLTRWTEPYIEELVLVLVMMTASLALQKDEWMLLAPIRGTCGPFKLSGNCLPVFEYKVFEKSIMEFVHIRVEVAKPNKVHFIATIDSTTAPERHGEVLQMKDKYRAPFDALALHLFRYFPLYRQG